MSRTCAALVLALAGGCSRLFGLHDVDPPADAPSDAVVAPPGDAFGLVVGSDQYSISAHGTHATAALPGVFVARRTDLSVIPTTVTIGATRTELAFAIPPGERYLLAVNGSAELQSTARTFALANPYIGRFDAPPITTATPFTLAITQPAGAGTFEPLVTTTGVRAQIGVATYANTPYTLDYKTFSGVGAALRVPSAAAGDALWYVRLALTATAPAYYTTDVAGSTPFTLADGGPSQAFAIAATAPTTPQICFQLTAPIAAEVARVAPAPIAPAEWPMSKAGQWQVNTVPDSAIDGPFGGLLVARSNFAAYETDFAGPVCYRSPYGETEVLLVSAQRNFQVKLAGANAGPTISAGTAYYFATASGLAIDLASIQLPVLGAPSLGSHPLATAGLGVPIDRTQPVALELVTKIAGATAPTDYAVGLYELATDAVTPIPNTTLRAIVQYSVTEPRVLIDPARLVTGHHYVFAMVARVGYPDAPDYRRIALPYAVATTWSQDFVPQ